MRSAGALVGVLLVAALASSESHARSTAFRSDVRLGDGGHALAGDRPTFTTISPSAGAKVFAPGTLNFAGTVLEGRVSALLANLWRQLARP
jgi:hypothetical protein